MTNNRRLPPLDRVLAKGHQRSGTCLPEGGIQYIIDFEGERYRVTVATQRGIRNIERVPGETGSRKPEKQARYQGRKRVG